MRRAAALAGLALLAGCAAIPRGRPADGADLSGLLAFADPGQCVAGPALDRLVHSLLRDTTRPPVRYGPVEVPPRYRALVGPARLGPGSDPWEASAALRGTWLGLPMAGVAARGYTGGDGAPFRLLFRAEPARVRAALAGAGLVPAPDPLSHRPAWHVGLLPAGPGVTAFECTANG